MGNATSSLGDITFNIKYSVIEEIDNKSKYRVYNAFLVSKSNAIILKAVRIAIFYGFKRTQYDEDGEDIGTINYRENKDLGIRYEIDLDGFYNNFQSELKPIYDVLPDHLKNMVKGLAYSLLCFIMHDLLSKKDIKSTDTVVLNASGFRAGESEETNSVIPLARFYQSIGFKTSEIAIKEYTKKIESIQSGKIKWSDIPTGNMPYKNYIPMYATVTDILNICRVRSTHSISSDDFVTSCIEGI